MFLDLIGGAAIAALTSIIACRVLVAAGPLDAQSAERHAHQAPTPTSGGIGIALGFGVGLMVLALFSSALRGEISATGVSLLSTTSIFSYVLLLIGFWDDARPLSARLKFVVFATLAVAAAVLLGPVAAFAFGAEVHRLPAWFALVGTALWIFTLINVVNFMDGANGLAMGSMAIGFAWLGALSLTQGEGTGAGAALAACGIGALIGFLYWNFPHGRLFAGDSGALFSGGLAALSSVLIIHRTGLSPLVPAIVFFPLLADGLITLAWRAIRRHSLLDGHSEHVYQIAIRGGMSHGEIALVYWAAMAGCGAIAFLVARDPGFAAWLALAALSISAVVLSVVIRRFASRRNVGGV